MVVVAAADLELLLVWVAPVAVALGEWQQMDLLA
jgi:hypothetical protein